jgi:uncharacterized protein (DUF1330 family)
VPAYVIVESETIDAAVVEKYRAMATPTVNKYGGRYIARGAAVEAFEGEPSSRRVTMIEFPDMDAARQWYRSPDYAEALAVGKNAFKRRMILAPGL